MKESTDEFTSGSGIRAAFVGMRETGHHDPFVWALSVRVGRSQYAQRKRDEVEDTGKEIASAVRSALADRVGQEHFEAWFGSGVEFSFQDGRVRVSAGDKFRVERLKRGFRHDLSEVGRFVTGKHVDIDFCVNPALGTNSRCRTSSARSVAVETGNEPVGGVPPSNPSPRELPTDERPTFVVGPEHKVAVTSAEMVLQQPGRVTPLFVYGPTGCGKSMFLESVRREACRRGTLRRVVSVTAEQFTTQFLEALEGKGLPNFRRKYRDVELLLIDDLQFFSGKRSTLGELQNTVDTLLRERRQLVLAADRSPAELTGFPPTMLGKLSGGVVCSLPYGEFATRRRIAARCAERHGVLPDDVLDLLAVRLPGDARKLSGAVNRLFAVSQALDRPIDVELAHGTLDDIFRLAGRAVRLADIEEAVCDVFGLEKDTLQSGERTKGVSQPRMLAMWLARKHTRAGLSEICRYFGRRSHSTVISAERQVKRWLTGRTPIRVAHGEFPIEDAIRRVESRLRTG